MADTEGSGVPALTAAAEALESELRRFERLTTAVQHERLSSEKNLRRSAEILGELADCEERLGARLRDLVDAIAAARDHQAAQADMVRERGEEIRRRAELLRELLTRFEAIKNDMTRLNQQVKEALQGASDAGAAGPDDAAALAPALKEIDAVLEQLIGDAEGLRTAADAEGFEDVARQVEALRQQLLATRNRAGLLRKSLAGDG